MFDFLIKLIRGHYRTDSTIPLHAPVFSGDEKRLLIDCIESTYVSSVGAYVDRFENDVAVFTRSKHAVAVVNGTAALHAVLLLSGVEKGDLVITQPLTFVATCNSISYCGAEPVFVDVDRQTLGMCPLSLENWLNENALLCDDGLCRSKIGDRVIRACVPMHTFGHPAELDELLAICNKWRLLLIEDAAESLGSYYKGKHTGTIGAFGIISFNGNKIITAGGGGIILTKDATNAQRAKHLTTTAKIQHPYEYVHDTVGYNYRLPNLNASLGCAQMKALPVLLNEKRKLANYYIDSLKCSELVFITEPPNTRSNYWLNSVICESRQVRDILLNETNKNGIMTRPIWKLMTLLPMYSSCRRGPLNNAEWLADRVVNLPSSVRMPFIDM